MHSGYPESHYKKQPQGPSEESINTLLGPAKARVRQPGKGEMQQRRTQENNTNGWGAIMKLITLPDWIWYIPYSAALEEYATEEADTYVSKRFCWRNQQAFWTEQIDTLPAMNKPPLRPRGWGEWNLWIAFGSAKVSWVAIPFKTISISIQLQVLGEERSMSFLLCTQAVLSKRSKWSGSQSRDTKTTKVGNESDPSLVQAHRGTPCTKRTSNQGGKGRGVHGGLRTLWRVPNWFPKFLHTTFSVVTAYSNVLTLKTSVSVYHFFVSIFKLDMNGYYTIYSKSTFYKNSGQHWRVNKILFAYQSFTDTVSKSQCFH